jgi:titin
VTIASAPTNIAVTYGHELANVTFTNGDDGGSPITDYEYSIDGGATWTARNIQPLSAEITIPGLPNGVVQSLRLRSITAQGAGESSIANAIMVPVPAVSLPVLAIEVGATSRIEGSGFVPMSDIRIEMHSTPTLIGTIQSDANGNFTTSISIPTEFAIGNHRLVFIYALTGIQANSLPITVKLREAIAVVVPSATPSATPTAKKPSDSSVDASASPTPESTGAVTPEPTASASGSTNAESSADTDSNNYTNWMWLILVVLVLLGSYIGLRTQRRKN